MRKRKKRLKFFTHLDMTPLIDCVFLLNIFFLLSSSFILQPGIKVNLPQSNINEPQTDKSVEITITQENLLFYNADRISFDELKLKFKSLAKTSPDIIIVLKADGNVKHSKVVEIMASAKENNLSNLAIATRPKEDDSL
ncbi:MAG: biopolymer transport protein [uncultured bacterium]|nr:MAG: biopolymer transport protein [uncultured bacterium]